MNATVYNSAAAINGWQVKWNLTSGSSVTDRWNAQISQAGTAVTAANLPYNATIPSGGAITFGFNASGTPKTPASFTLNGQACARPHPEPVGLCLLLVYLGGRPLWLPSAARRAAVDSVLRSGPARGAPPTHSLAVPCSSCRRPGSRPLDRQGR